MAAPPLKAPVSLEGAAPAPEVIHRIRITLTSTKVTFPFTFPLTSSLLLMLNIHLLELGACFGEGVCRAEEQSSLQEPQGLRPSPHAHQDPSPLCPQISLW